MAKRDIYAYSGKILRIDLTSAAISYEPTMKYAREWLGGSGLGQWILYNEVKPWVTPYEPANRLIFGAGPLVGTLAPGSSRISADSINGLTGGVGSSSSDSHFGYEMKAAGYDQIVLLGKAKRPVYLWIDDGHVELKDAVHLCGKTTWETVDAIRHELDDNDIHVVSVGPAGENLCRGACIIQDKGRAFGRCGLGAVMGSKNLKAIAVRGTGSIEIAEPERFMKTVDRLRGKFDEADKSVPPTTDLGTTGIILVRQERSGISYKNAQYTTIPDEDFKSLNPYEIQRKYKARNVGYMACPVACSRYYRVNDGLYAGLETEGFQFEALHDFGCRLAAASDPSFLIKMNAYCNQLGMDVDSVSISIAWAMECYQRGILTQDDADGLKLAWGDTGVILELTRKIACREGFGNILAEGCARAADILGRNSSYYALHIKGQDLYEPLRDTIGWSLGVCTATRGGGHTTSAVLPGVILNWGEEIRSKRDNSTPFSDDPFAYEGKAEQVFYFERLQRINNSFGVCHFCTPGILDLAELYSAATGWETTEDDLRKAAARILNVEKAFNLLRTNLDRKDDYPTPRELAEPIPSGSKKGWRLEKGKWDKLLDEYYEMNGWDKKTSFPSRKCLEELDLRTVADDLEKIGKLGTV